MKSRMQRGRQQLKVAILECCQINMNRKENITGYEVRKSCCWLKGKNQSTLTLLIIVYFSC